MERMEGADATFIYTESERAPGNIGACLVLAESGDHVHDALRSRLHTHTAIDPLFRRRLHRVPLDLHHPVWAEDPDFDVERHIDRVDVAGLDAPAEGAAAGGDNLTEILADLMSRPLDHDRPLWHVTHVEGLSEGRSAIVIRTHHASVDGVAGITLLAHLLDVAPDLPDPTQTAAGSGEGGEPAAYGTESGRDQTPGTIGLLLGAGLDLARDPLRSVRTGVALVRDLATSVMPGRRPPTEVLGTSFAPATPFNVALCGRRSVRLVSFDLASATRIRRAARVTVNDLVLALVAGALRRHLLALEALPRDPLVCYLPMTTGAQAQGNNTTVISVRLATDEPDPRRRVELVGLESTRAKRRAVGATKPLILDVSALAGPALGALMERMAVAMGVTQRLRLAGNVTISNVARIPVPLWSSGTRVVDFFPIGVITDGSALNVTYLSYEDRLQVSVMADAEALPDPEALVAALEAEWAELIEVYAADA